VFKGGELLPEGDALPEGGGAPRRSVLSSEVDRLSGPVASGASGARVHLPVSVQQVSPLLHHQRTPASSGRRELSEYVSRCSTYCVRLIVLLSYYMRYFSYCHHVRRLFPPSMRKKVFYSKRCR
jgi:hypothetical protein